jgi:hypothetical protein
MWDDERALRDALRDAPGLLPGGDGAAVVDELQVPGVGRADLALVDAHGRLALVECKLQKNTEIRRSVVGQIFAYGSGLWQLSLARFEDLWSARSGRPLLDDVRDARGSEVDEPVFRRNLNEALTEGRFRLIIAIDEITDEIRRIIEYVDKHTSDGLSLVAFELGLFKEGGVELLIPNTYGDELATIKEQISKTPWSLDEVAAALEGKPGVDTVHALLTHASTHGATFLGGTAEEPSGAFHYAIVGGVRPLWWLFARSAGPDVHITLGSVARVNSDAAKRMLDALLATPILGAAWSKKAHETLLRGRPRLDPDLLVKPGVREAILAALDAAILDGSELPS